MLLCVLLICKFYQTSTVFCTVFKLTDTFSVYLLGSLYVFAWGFFVHRCNTNTCSLILQSSVTVYDKRKNLNGRHWWSFCDII